jgi:hypothetical protein
MTRAPLTATLIVAFAAFAAGCGATPNILPTNDFNRPSDIAFMCFGAFDTGDTALHVSGRPMRVCHPPGVLNMFPLDDYGNPTDVGTDPTPGIGNRTFAFMPNSASGDLSLIDADKWKIVDLDRSSAGYGRVPIGAVPEQISASQDGCQLVTANRGSCDLTVIDPRDMIQPVLQAENATSTIPAANVPLPAARAPIDGNGMPLEVAPYEVAFLPQDTSQLDGANNLCQHDTAQTSTPWRVLVTYPSCDLVALIDVPSMKIVDSVKVTTTADGVTLVGQGNAPVCPIADCGEGRNNPSPMPPQARPSGIAIVPTGELAYVGLSSLPYVVAIPVNAAAGTLDALGGHAIALHNGAVGTNRIRLSVDPYRYKSREDKTYAGVYVGEPNLNRNYLYVIARDGTLAVIDVFIPGSEKECETNIDPLNLPDGLDRDTAPLQACIPVDDKHRRPGVDGPALRFPTAPVDVTAADIPVTDRSDNREESVTGSYAWVMTASGAIYLVNIDPVWRQYNAIFRPQKKDSNGYGITDPTTGKPVLEDAYVSTPSPTTEAPPYPNTVRNRNLLSYSLSLDPTSGPPRVEVLPAPPSIYGPYLEPFWTKGSADDATAMDAGFRQTAIFFPDPSAARAQSWSVNWQGAFIGSRLAARVFNRGNKTILEDDGVDFCVTGPGVLAGDIVTLNGCTKDADCGPGLSCLEDTSASMAPGGLTVTGLCVNSQNLDLLKKNHTCDEFIKTVRRYEVSAPHNQTLELVPHLDEVVRSALTPCRIQTDPKSTINDCADPADPSTATYFVCQDDPLGGKAPRCLGRPCASDNDCRIGRTCQVLTDSNGDKVTMPNPNKKTETDPAIVDARYCVDAPPFTDAVIDCFYQLVPYSVQVGRGFLVSGSSAGVLGGGTTLPTLPNVTDQVPVCGLASRDNPNTNDYRLVSRIAIDGVGANQCTGSLFDTPYADGRSPPPASALIDPNNLNSAINPDSPTGKRLAVVKSNPIPNPCLFFGGPVNSDPLAAQLDPNNPPQHVRALFQNTQVAFVVANLDRGPSTLLDLRFDVRGGFSPQTVIQQSTIEISAPARIVLGPIDSSPQDGSVSSEVPYLFVVDQRRLGVGLGGGPTRGQLLRIHPRGQLSTLTSTQGLLPIFDDYTRSGGLFPVQ